uniref:NAD(P)-dependent oxidoreductase n=1 Tax=Paractinoplanes polyasparticus TaxID=2856853 RepID=UPI001C8487A4|nr:NAD(P)-dependent oxidoreductase [Actinoplanes polyasparticus]
MKPTVAVLGTGIMGTGMARSLLRAALPVVVWNRNPARSRPLAEAGAVVAGSVAVAVAEANVVITSLFDVEAVEQTVRPALGQFSDSAVWVQASTVSARDTERLADLAREAGVAFVDAPVLGTKAPAENGRLVVLASGDPALREATAETFAAIGAKTLWVSAVPGDASRLKLVLNAWVGTLIGGIAQSVAMAESLGLDPRLFLDAITGQAVDSPYAQAKGRMMIDRDFTSAFRLGGLLKDTGLIVDTLREAGTDPALAVAVRDRLDAAAARGHADEDIAAVIASYRD